MDISPPGVHGSPQFSLSPMVPYLGMEFFLLLKGVSYSDPFLLLWSDPKGLCLVFSQLAQCLQFVQAT